MKILEIITVPFFTPRGTAFSSLERTKALARMGHTVHVLTYPIGDPINVENVYVHRIPRLPFITSIQMGPSFKKLILDVSLAIKTAWWLLVHGPFDIILAHEESAFWVALLKPFVKGSFIYDMHSSLAEQLSNFRYSKSNIIRKLFESLEQLALQKADGVIVICPELEALVRRIAPRAPVGLIENLPVSWDVEPPPMEQIDLLRSMLRLDNCRIVLYTGSFGKNQGVELALEAVARLASELPDLRLVLIGGTGADMARVRSFAETRDMDGFSLFLAPQPHTMMPTYMALADILLSPRCEGTNTPLKIYSYLSSGKPIVATNLLTHTQVLSSGIAELVEPDSASLAEGILKVISDAEYAARLGREGARLAREVYGIERYMQQLQEVLHLAVPPQCRVR